MSEYIDKISINGVNYDIQASSIGTVSQLTIESNSATQADEIKVKSTNSNNAANIKFETSSSDSSVATNGIVAGTIGLNAKGNLAVESLSKHLNLESKKAIQLKPTTSIIIDTARKVEASASHENEAEVVIKNDDASTGEEYGYLKVNARAIDLRCHDHGGIALQPCGRDDEGNENKIKFESDRTVDANAIANGNNYNGEGGKGVEFGTFNNEHTSLYTKDYRFNDQGKVYSVTRTLETVGNKTDYITQSDDFKDIPVDDKGNPGTYNSTTGKWEKDSNSDGKYLLEASWNSIVKTAHALNDQSWTDTNISGKGNLQITVSDEVEWVELPEYTGNSITLGEGKQDPKRSYVNDGNVYKINNNYYICKLTANGEHHLNFESNSTIKLESKYDDIELNAGDKVQVSAPVIQLEASDIDESTGENNGIVDFSTTSAVSFMVRKINKSGQFEGSNPKIILTSFNNFGKKVYENTETGLVRIPYDSPLYLEDGSEYKAPLVRTNKVSVYTNSSHTNPAPEGYYLYQRGGIPVMIEVDSTNMAKKKATICSLEPQNLYTDQAGNNLFSLDINAEYAGSEPSLYTSSNTAATEGFYIVSSEESNYIIYVDDNGKLAKFNIGNNSTTLCWCADLTNLNHIDSISYENIKYGGNDSASSNEEEILNGEQLESGSITCDIADIVTLIDFFKNGNGVNNGPWNPSNLEDGPK